MELIQIGLLCAALWYCFSTHKIIKEVVEDGRADAEAEKSKQP